MLALSSLSPYLKTTGERGGERESTRAEYGGHMEVRGRLMEDGSLRLLYGATEPGHQVWQRIPLHEPSPRPVAPFV